MSIALRRAADALDELRPAPEHMPAQDEVKRTLTKLSDARASENGSDECHPVWPDVSSDLATKTRADTHPGANPHFRLKAN